MGRVRPGKHPKPPKPQQHKQQQNQQQQDEAHPPEQPPSIDPQLHRLSSSLAAPPSSSLSPYSAADLALFHPSQETINWLYSLPLPPGVTQQPLPQTSEDWALVEKFRWLCQGLVLAGEYERERRRRVERGEDPYSEWEEWDPRQSGNPLVTSAVQSLMNSHAPTHPHPSYALSHPHPHPQYAHPHYAQQYSSYNPAEYHQPTFHEHLPSHVNGVPLDYIGFAGDEDDEEEDGYEDEPYSEGDPAEADEFLAEHTYDFPTLETLQSFAASGLPPTSSSSADPSSSSSAHPLGGLDLSALTSSLGPTGLGELAAAAGVSVEGLSAAMNGQLGGLIEGVEGEGGAAGGANPASLPSLIAAIAELEQCVARLSLEATEARNLQKSLRDEMATRSTPASAAAQMKGSTAGKAQAVAATLARAGLKPMKRKVKGGRVVSSRNRLPPSAARAPAPAPAAAPPAPAAATNGHGGHSHGQHQHHHHHHHCSDCGESLSSHDDGASAQHSPAPTAPSSRPSSPPLHAPVAPPPVTVSSNGVMPPPQPQQQQQGEPQQWEDGELMKALQSVSLLDRRADEYRERLRVLKEQIHHHAALADALASPNATAAAEEKKPFGQSVSDAGLEYVAVTDYQRRAVERMANHLPVASPEPAAGEEALPRGAEREEVMKEEVEAEGKRERKRGETVRG
ncbi:hypothetical protein JCM11251_007406 [Rhodosporidiobolus azoricus]